VTLSAGQKKLLHTALVGFATGALAYISSWIVGAPLPGWRVMLIAVLVAGFSRAAGALLAKIETQPPGAP
jgi:hypothetical protein